VWSAIACAMPATAAHLTQGRPIEERLDQRRKAEFWAALEAETSDRKYLDELAEADAALAGDTEESLPGSRPAR